MKSVLGQMLVNPGIQSFTMLHKLPTDNTLEGPCSLDISSCWSPVSRFPNLRPHLQAQHVHTHQSPALSTPQSCRDTGADTWVLQVWCSAFRTRRHYCPSSNSFSLLIKPTGPNLQLGPCSLGPQKYTSQYGWDPRGEHHLAPQMGTMV